MQFFLWVQNSREMQCLQPEPEQMLTVTRNLGQRVQISVTLSLTCYRSPSQVTTEQTIQSPTQHTARVDLL